MSHPAPHPYRQSSGSRAAPRSPETLVGLALLLAVATCGTRDDPSTCKIQDDCRGPGRFCDTWTHLCADLRDGGVKPDSGPRGGTGGMEPATPAGGASGSGPGDSDGGPDPGVIDAPLAPDRTPDAENSCTVDPDCGPSGHCLDMKCVGCIEDSHCPMDRKKCGPAKTCVECLTSPDCGYSPDKRLCNASNSCVECLAHADCKNPDRPLCAAGACVGCGGGGGDAGCAAKDKALPICLPDSGRCAECGDSNDCSVDTKPICIDSKCAPCTKDSECADRDMDKPGICLAPREGRCAKDDETIYVQNANPCSMAAGEGHADMPFCQAAPALRAISNTRRVIRIRGPEPIQELDVQTTGALVSIIGQKAATITSSSGTGVHIRGGDVLLRSLEVSGSRGTGIIVENGATVRLNRVIVKQNLTGGLQVLGGAGFEVNNSVFASNAQGGIGPGRFGGVSLSVPTGGRPNIFRASTVAINEDIGVLCPPGSNLRLTGVLLTGNLAGDQFNCMLTPSSKAGPDAKFIAGRPFHIDQGAPCENAATAAEMPPDDIDGEPRPFPANGRSDCGADEFHPAAQP